MLISNLYIEYFLLLFTVLLLKLQYELLFGSKAESVSCLLYSNCICLQRRVVHQWWRGVPNKQWELDTQNYCFALYDFYVKDRFLRAITQVTLHLSNQIYNGSIKLRDFERQLWFPLGTSFCMSLAFQWFHYVFEQKQEWFIWIYPSY